MSKETCNLHFAIRWGPLAALAAFPLLLLRRALFAGEAFFWGTPLLQFVPWQRLAATMWRTGHLPLWNPLVGCGAPLAANYQTAAFYPLNLLYLLLPAEMALSWTTALHLLLASWGMYHWGRAIGLERFPAFIGALSLSGSGFLVARAALFPSIALTFPWLAVWLWRAEVLVRRGRFNNALWLGLSLGLGLLAGHAQTAFYGGLLLTAYLIFRTVQEAIRRKRQTRNKTQETEDEIGTIPVLRLVIGHWSLVISSLAIGLGLAAVQLLPTAELMVHSQRSAGVDYDFATTYSLWPWRLITFLAPDFFGNPGRGNYWGYATYWEDAAYVGVLPLLLAVDAALSRSRKHGREKAKVGLARFWATCAVIALVLALGKNTPVFPFLFHHIPSFRLFQAPARWLAVTTIALAALAALGTQWWSVDHPGQRRGIAGLVAGLALLIGGLAAPRLVPGIKPTFGPATARLGGTLAVAGTLVVLRSNSTVQHSASRANLPVRPQAENRTKLRAPTWWQAAVGAFVALDLLLSGWSLIPTIDQSLYSSDTATAAVLQDESGPVRVYWPTDPTHHNREYDAEQRVKFTYLTFEDFGPRDVDHWQEMREVLLPNTGMLDYVASANNFDPLLVGRYVHILEAAVEAPSLLRIMGVTHIVSDQQWSGGQIIEDWRLGNAQLYRLPDALGRAWVVPVARQVPPDEILATLSDPAFDPAAEVLLESPTSSTQHSTSTIQYHVTLQDTPNRVTIHAIVDRPGYLVLADAWYPGWQATVDGVPAEILRANYAFRSIWLEAGDHRVEMAYYPTLIFVGGVISLAVLMLLVAGLSRARARETRA